MASPTLELVRGQNVSLEDINSGNDRLAITVRSRFPTESGVRPDVSILLLGADGKVRSNSDFVFYNQREAAGGSVRISEASAQEEEATETASSDVLLVDLASLLEDIARCCRERESRPGPHYHLRGGGGARNRRHAE